MDLGAVEYYAKFRNIKQLRNPQRVKVKKPAQTAETFKAQEPLSKEEIDKLRELRKRNSRQINSSLTQHSPNLIEIPTCAPNVANWRHFLRNQAGKVIYVVRDIEETPPTGLARKFDIFQGERRVDLVPYRVPPGGGGEWRAPEGVAVQCDEPEEVALSAAGVSSRASHTSATAVSAGTGDSAAEREGGDAAAAAARGTGEDTAHREQHGQDGALNEQLADTDPTDELTD